jgi:hypothetical protein
MRMKALSFLVILALATPASAQGPAHDPYALFISQERPSDLKIWDSICICKDGHSCVRLADGRRDDSTAPNAVCKRNTSNWPIYRPRDDKK